MKIQEQYIESIPEFWLSYLINAVTDNINDDELKEIQEFEKSLSEDCNHFVIDNQYCEGNEHYFGLFRGMGHQLIDVQITQFKKD